MNSSTNTGSARVRVEPGVVLAALAAGYLTINVARALINPSGFATFFGTPLASAEDVTFVRVYATRTAVLVGLAVLLMVRRDWRTLAGLFALAVTLPLTDAWLVYAADGSTGIVIRHLITALVIASIAALLSRTARRR
ncbi:MAG: DUF4267 domain-containing protein [Nocardioides sp.]